MQKKMINPRILTLTTLILVAAIVRLLPHPPNFAPVTAMALFGGAYFTNKKMSFMVPLIILFLTDIVLGFHYLVPAVYASFVMITLLGMTLRNKITVRRTLITSLMASCLFFVVTNFAEWSYGVMYPRTMSGLAECYTMAIPFFGNTLLGDIFFTFVMFGAFEAAKVKFSSLQEVKG